MIRSFRSTVTDPRQRGREFGATHASNIKSNIEIYRDLFLHRGSGRLDLDEAGRQALHATQGFAPDLHEEMLGLAEGAGVDPAFIGMLNGRTEILAMIGANTRGECSVVIHVPEGGQAPVAVQTWDWYTALKYSWLVWEIPLANGTTTKTMTEYGIVGKSGLNTRGLGILFTILHHQMDGRRMGVPVHVVSRALMDSNGGIAEAQKLAALAGVSASSSLNLVAYENGAASALTLELHPGGPSLVRPDAEGFLLHTNHFLAATPAQFDTEPASYPDTLARLNLLSREAAALGEVTTPTVLGIMASHAGGSCAVCCHHDEAQAKDMQYDTLSTVVLDVKSGRLDVHAGGPCTHPLSSHTPLDVPSLQDA